MGDRDTSCMWEGAIQFILKVYIHDIQYGLLKKLQLRVPPSDSHSSQRLRFYINSNASMPRKKWKENTI